MESTGKSVSSFILSAPASDDAYELVTPGMHDAVCIDLKDMGEQTHPEYGTKRKVVLVFEVSEQLHSGQRKQIWNWYNATIKRGSNLRRDLDEWRGRPFTPEELGEFEVASVIGAPCRLVITHKKNQNGDTRCKVSSIMPAGDVVLTPQEDIDADKVPF